MRVCVADEILVDDLYFHGIGTEIYLVGFRSPFKSQNISIGNAMSQSWKWQGNVTQIFSWMCVCTPIEGDHSQF